MAKSETTAEPEEEPPPPLASLKSVELPGPAADQLGRYVKNKAAAVQLGKALFWDTRIGSDNKTSCATCHFHAGADSRIKNQLSPGLLGGDKKFQLGGPNYTLKASDFPLTRHSDIDNAATRTSDRNDVVSSQGVFTTDFADTSATGAPDACTMVSDAVVHGGSGFNLNGVNTRRVEPRNAPSVINSIFNFRNFWDGRASNIFNGGEPFGARNPNAFVWKQEGDGVRQIKVEIPTSSLGSLASGPPLSENEMSCRNRSFSKLGKKLANIAVLSDQKISASDSVLGPLTANKPTYAELIKRAFREEYWNYSQPIIVPNANVEVIDLAKSQRSVIRAAAAPSQSTHLESNFALFFGIAVQMYQATLVSDDTPFDRFVEGDSKALTAQQQRGLTIFRGPAQCVHCHAGAEFTSASFANLKEEGRLDQRAGRNDPKQVFRYDNGFFNTGVRPTAEDPGVAGPDPFGNSLSEVRINQSGRNDLLGSGFDVGKELAVPGNALLAIDGAFKTPSLRNVELTGPYFHNGGKATLMQVVDFYNRGGDFRIENEPVPDPTVRPLGLSQKDKEDLVAFLLSLTDDRVRFRKAPFDHPSLCVPHGHEGDHKTLEVNGMGNAIDTINCIAEVGSGGAKTPLATFLNLDPFKR